jgi:hypothetical protein
MSLTRQGRRPTLALVAEASIDVETRHYWQGQITERGFNRLDLRRSAPETEGVRLVEASIGLVVVNRSILVPYRELATRGILYAAHHAHQLEVPVYLTDKPSEDQLVLEPFRVIATDFSNVSRIWPPVFGGETTPEATE